MNDKNTTSYIDLATETYHLFVDAFATSNQHALEYTKSVWEIAARPYPSSAVETAVRENFDRTNQIVSLTVGELQGRGQRSAALIEKLAAQASKLQETYVQSLRGMVDTGISNMKYVKDTATQQFDDVSKRLDDIQSRATAQASQN